LFGLGPLFLDSSRMILPLSLSTASPHRLRQSHSLSALYGGLVEASMQNSREASSTVKGDSQTIGEYPSFPSQQHELSDDLHQIVVSP
jgi:hypothetical protein